LRITAIVEGVNLQIAMNNRRATPLFQDKLQAQKPTGFIHLWNASDHEKAAVFLIWLKPEIFFSFFPVG